MIGLEVRKGKQQQHHDYNTLAHCVFVGIRTKGTSFIPFQFGRLQKQKTLPLRRLQKQET